MESQTRTEIGNNKYNSLMSFDKVDIFVRKFQEEDGVNLPYIYVGKGKLFNPTNAKKSLKFDVIVDTKLSNDLFDQFNIVD